MRIRDFAGMSAEESLELARIIECCEARDEASSWDDPLAAGSGLADELDLVIAGTGGSGVAHASL